MYTEGLQAKARLSLLSPPTPPGAARYVSAVLAGKLEVEAAKRRPQVSVTSRVCSSPGINVFGRCSLEFAQTSLLPASSVATPGPCGHECL